VETYQVEKAIQQVLAKSQAAYPVKGL
jgi:hypothetical protein